MFKFHKKIVITILAFLTIMMSATFSGCSLYSHNDATINFTDVEKYISAKPVSIKIPVQNKKNVTNTELLQINNDKNICDIALKYARQLVPNMSMNDILISNNALPGNYDDTARIIDIKVWPSLNNKNVYNSFSFLAYVTTTQKLINITTLNSFFTSRKINIDITVTDISNVTNDELESIKYNTILQNNIIDGLSTISEERSFSLDNDISIIILSKPGNYFGVSSVSIKIDSNKKSAIFTGFFIIAISVNFLQSKTNISGE
jgi:hypothetical protein